MGFIITYNIIPKGLTNYFDAHQNAMYFLKNARSALKNVHTQLPTGSSYQKLVKISYLSLTSTATVLTGCNPHTGTTGTAGAASPAVFDFPSDEPLSSKGVERGGSLMTLLPPLPRNCLKEKRKNKMI